MIAIRLKKTGKKNRKGWRIVVAKKNTSRDGAYIEDLGFVNPLVNPPEVKINLEQYEFWIKKGAQPSVRVSRLVRGVRKTGAN